MGFPSSPTSKIRSRNDISAVSSLLSSSHAGHYLLWSAAEESVDASLFQQQVIELSFPGFPAPPLGLLFKICTSIENWLAADPENVAVIYCMVGANQVTETRVWNVSLRVFADGKGPNLRDLRVCVGVVRRIRQSRNSARLCH